MKYRPTALLVTLTKSLVTWGYYRVGWLRAAGLGVRIDWRARVSPFANLDGVVAVGMTEVGRDVVMGEGSYVGAGLIQAAVIGRYCSLGPGVVIGPSEHRLDHWTTSPYESRDAGEPPGTVDKLGTAASRPIIEDGVWVGANVVILRGVRIGTRAVIAAGAVVACDVPPGEIWGGVPARRIRGANGPLPAVEKRP